jgi:TPR repeat protein
MRQTGINYEMGRGVAADAARALQWYLRGADAGDVGCLHNAAVHLFEGRGGAPTRLPAERGGVEALRERFRVAHFAAASSSAASSAMT